MKILNFGSLNIDHVYKVDHFVRPGETTDSQSYNQYCGGKGLNQSIALALAGAEVYHAGKVGNDGQILIEKLKEAGVDTRFIKIAPEATGHAIIQVNSEGDNCIILHGGANQNISEEDIENTLAFFTEGDYLLLQNEINNIALIIKKAKVKGLKVILNPAPMNKAVLNYPLELVDLFVVNEIEGSDLTGETEPSAIIQSILSKYPDAAVALTLGEKGVKFGDNNGSFSIPAVTNVKVVDTTAAGDTFIGYFLSCMSQGISVVEAIKISCNAAAICISRPGASNSIPRKDEVSFE